MPQRNQFALANLSCGVHPHDGVQFCYVLNETDDSDEGMVMDGLRSLFDNWVRVAKGSTIE